MIDLVNRTSEVFVTGITRLFGWLPPLGVLLVHSLLIGVLALIAYALVSNQAAIRRTKNRLTARLLEIRLFQDDPLAVLGAFFRVLGGTCVYLKDSLKPMLILLPVVVLWITQLAGYFEWRPLKPGESVEIAATLEKGRDVMNPPAVLHVPPGLKIETPAFRSFKDNEIAWRVLAQQEAAGAVRIEAAGDSVEKEIAVSTALVQASPKRVKTGFWTKLYYPFEPSLSPGSAFTEVRIHSYPNRQLKVFGWEVHWLIILLAASILFGFALKKPFKVEF